MVRFIKNISNQLYHEKPKVKFPILLGTTILLTLLSGCHSSNRAEPIDPPIAALEKAIKIPNDSSMFYETTEWIPQNWWSLFNDNQLTEFIETALSNNPTIQAAQSNILMAASNADRARSILFPSLFWGGDVSRQKLSETGIIPFEGTSTNNANETIGSSGVGHALQQAGAAMAAATPAPATGGMAGIPVYFTQYETELILTYDFDIWKKNRNSLRAAIGEIKARIADQAFIQIELGILVAQIYYKLQIDYKRLEIAKALIKNQTEYLKLVNKRVQGKLENVLTYHTNQTSLTDYKQQLILIQGDIEINEVRLRSLLAGDFEEEINDIRIQMQPLPRIPLPKNLPLHLIIHRPDIISQLWIIESAGKQIEVAKAGFYPDFNLTALFGFQTIHLHELFKWPSSYYNIDPAFTLPIFDGGRLLSNLHSAEVNYDLAIYQYNHLILNAVKEILEGITLVKNREQVLQETKKKLNYQEELLHLTSLKVANHINSKLDYLTSELALLIAQDQEITSLGNMIDSLLLLIKALGGGYSACNETEENLCESQMEET